MSRTRIAREITIHAPRHEVWKALSDFGHVSQLNPNIKRSYLTSLQESGVGTTRHCEMHAFGATIEEQVTGWEEDARLEVDAFGFYNLMSLKKMHECFQLQDNDEGTVLRGTLEYEVSEDVGSIMNLLIIDRTNIKSWNELLAGTKKFVESHEPVDRKSPLHTEEIRTVL